MNLPPLKFTYHQYTISAVSYTHLSPDAGIFTPFCQYVSAILLCFFSICRFYLCAIFFGIHNSSSVLPEMCIRDSRRTAIFICCQSTIKQIPCYCSNSKNQNRVNQLFPKGHLIYTIIAVSYTHLDVYKRQFLYFLFASFFPSSSSEKILKISSQIL